MKPPFPRRSFLKRSLLAGTPPERITEWSREWIAWAQRASVKEWPVTLEKMQ